MNQYFHTEDFSGLREISRRLTMRDDTLNGMSVNYLSPEDVEYWVCLFLLPSFCFDWTAIAGQLMQSGPRHDTGIGRGLTRGEQ